MATRQQLVELMQHFIYFIQIIALKLRYLRSNLYIKKITVSYVKIQ